MTNHKKPKGWVKEPVRHGLAARGIKTAQKKAVWPPVCAECEPLRRFTSDEESLFNALYDDAVNFYTQDYPDMPDEQAKNLQQIRRKLVQLNPGVKMVGGQMIVKEEIVDVEKFTEDEEDLMSALYDDAVAFYLEEIDYDKEQAKMLDRLQKWFHHHA